MTEGAPDQRDPGGENDRWSGETDGIRTGKEEPDRDHSHHRKDIYIEYYNAMPWHRDPMAFLTALRGERYKLVVDHNNGGGELYDLQEDPLEYQNLWDEERFRDVRDRMLVRMSSRISYTADPLPERHGPW